MYIILIILVALVLWSIFAYNRLISLTTNTGEAWSDIDVQLKRRYDLIPNLVNTVKAYATHESTVFEDVTKARTAAMSASTPEAKGAAEVGLAGALKSVFALAEAYPELKANENFKALQDQLAETEDKIQASRRFYNGNVRELNTTIQRFPGNIIANLFRFVAKEFFQVDSATERANPDVKF